MGSLSRISRQKLLKEADGYLDLAMVLSEHFPLTEASRHRIAQRALDTLNRLKGHPDCAHALLLRGQALRIMERHDEAIGPLRAASHLDPSNIHALLALGWCYKRTGKIDCAIQALELALERDQVKGIVHYNLACYWSIAKNVGLALSHLREAFELEPDYREMVAREPDFDAVRNHPEFVELTSVIV